MSASYPHLVLRVRTLAQCPGLAGLIFFISSLPLWAVLLSFILYLIFISCYKVWFIMLFLCCWFFFCIFISYRLETVSSSFCNSALVHLLVSFFVQCLSDVNFWKKENLWIFDHRIKCMWTFPHIIGDDLLLHSNNRICCQIIDLHLLFLLMEFKLELHWIRRKKINN